MLRLNCFFQANEGKYDEALQAAIALTAASLKDEGTLLTTHSKVPHVLTSL